MGGITLTDSDGADVGALQGNAKGEAFLEIPGGPLTSYSGEILFATAGTALPLSVDVRSVSIANLDVTNFGRFAFGESELEAISNAATGRRLEPRTAATVNTSSFTEPKPVNATHCAVIANGAAILADVQPRG